MAQTHGLAPAPALLGCETTRHPTASHRPFSPRQIARHEPRGPPPHAQLQRLVVCRDENPCATWAWRIAGRHGVSSRASCSKSAIALEAPPGYFRRRWIWLGTTAASPAKHEENPRRLLRAAAGTTAAHRTQSAAARTTRAAASSGRRSGCGTPRCISPPRRLRAR